MLRFQVFKLENKVEGREVSSDPPDVLFRLGSKLSRPCPLCGTVRYTCGAFRIHRSLDSTFGFFASLGASSIR